ncbi:DinB family protein, partial [Acinetobacter sp.]
MNFEKLFLYKQWSDQRLFKAIDQIDQVQYLEDYNFAKQQFNHMIIVEELFRSRLENKKALHSQTNTEFLPALDELKHRI